MSIRHLSFLTLLPADMQTPTRRGEAASKREAPGVVESPSEDDVDALKARSGRWRVEDATRRGLMPLGPAGCLKAAWGVGVIGPAVDERPGR